MGQEASVEWRLWGKEDGSLLGEEFELDWVQGPALTPVPEEEEEEEEGAPFRTPRDPGDGCPSPDIPPEPPPTHLRPGTTSQLPGLLSHGLLAGLSFAVGSSSGLLPLLLLLLLPLLAAQGGGGLQAALLALEVGLVGLGASYLLLCTALHLPPSLFLLLAQGTALGAVLSLSWRRGRGFLELRRPWGFSPEARRGSQGASRAAPGTLRKPELKETRVPQCSSQHCL